MLVRPGGALIRRAVGRLQAFANLISRVNNHRAIGNAMGKSVQSPLGFG
jgi:hypothetical protein